jgi:hypothetical protein
MTQERKERLLHREQFGDVWVDTRVLESRSQLMPNGCIEYTGPRHQQGYGMITVVHDDTLGFGMMTTHRLAMKMKLKSAIARHDYVLHKCKNPACMNPDHLYIGDHSDMVKQRGGGWKWKKNQTTLK